jgi:hypothetical protein
VLPEQDRELGARRALLHLQGRTLMATFIMVTAVVLTGACVLLWGLVLALVAANVVVALRHLASK